MLLGLSGGQWFIKVGIKIGMLSAQQTGTVVSSREIRINRQMAVGVQVRTVGKTAHNDI